MSSGPDGEPSDRPGGSLRRLLPDTRPLAVPAYRRLFISQAIAVVGSGITNVAVQQQIFDITGDSAWVGIASVVALVPLIAFGLWGGAIADTYDRRTLLLITSTGMAVTSLALWLLAIIGERGGESVWVVMGLLAAQQGFFAVNQPARAAIIPRIVPPEQIAAANALGMSVFSLGVIVGPLLVGVLIPIIGVPWLYFVDAVTLTGVLYAVFRLPKIPPLRTASGRATISEGLRYLSVKPVLLMTFVVDIIAMVCGMPRALFPQMAEQTFGDPPGGGPVLGLLNASLAIGALLGGLTSGWVHRIHRQGVAIVAAIVVFGFAMVAFGTTSVLVLAVIYLAIGGWSDLVSAVYRSTILQVAATDEMRGRMQGVFTVVVAGGPRLADLAHGLVASATSTTVATAGGGVLCVLLVLLAGWLGRSTLLRYDSRRPMDV